MKVPLHLRSLVAFVLTLLGVAAVAQTIVMTPNTTTLSPGGGNITFTASITYPTTPATLGFSVLLPSGWSYLGGTTVAGTTPAEPVITPTVGHIGQLDWAFVTPPASPVSFTFTTAYPAGAAGTQLFTTTLFSRDGTGAPATTVTGPLVAMAGASSAIAWNGGTGNWSTAAQWTPATAPINAGAAHFSASIAAGIATLDTPVTIDNLTLSGGTINGSSTLTLTGLTSSWTAGVLSGVGELVIAPGATLTASTNTPHNFSERTIRNQGTFVWVDRGGLFSGSGGAFINSTGATFIDGTVGTVDYQIANTSGGAFSFTNAGTYVKTTTSSTVVSVPFANSGNVLVSAGSLRFSDAFTQTGGLIYIASGATLRVDNGLTFAAGTLHGGGTVVANLTNSGFLSPGDPIGTLTVSGNLSLLGTSKLLFDLNRPVQGTGYDFLNVSGTVSLGGTLSLTMNPGAEAFFSGTDTITLITGSGVSGTFLGLPNGTRFTATHGTGSFVINYGANSVTLNQFLPIPEPSTWALMIAGLGVVAIATLRRRR